MSKNIKQIDQQHLPEASTSRTIRAKCRYNPQIANVTDYMKICTFGCLKCVDICELFVIRDCPGGLSHIILILLICSWFSSKLLCHLESHVSARHVETHFHTNPNCLILSFVCTQGKKTLCTVLPKRILIILCFIVHTVMRRIPS